MAVDNRKLDIKDILDKATKGWVANPVKPTFIMEGHVNKLSGLLGRTTITNGVIFIKKDYEYDPEKISPTIEDRIWTFNCVIISESEVLLQGIFDQMVEVFNRYTSAPWATGTLGTGTTYDYARVVKGIEDVREQPQKYVMDVQVILCEYTVDVVIA